MATPTSETTHFGYSDIPLSEKQERVDEVFHAVARRYDLMNDVMSGGLHRVWKDAFVAMANPAKTVAWRHLDVAGGTGDIAIRMIKAAGPQARSVLTDINADMLGVGRERVETEGLDDVIETMEANAEALPFADKSFDCVTIAFGIRNVPRVDVALREFRRVLRPGGRFLCLEFSRVDIPGLDRLYDRFSFDVIPIMGRMIAGDAEPYRYLVESIRRFPDQETFAGMIRAAGFARVSVTNLTGGVAAIHSGWRL
jgi:demethylmenaquinone methyltransferase/2-methoxy-6-polyprenyl-1,4-benzoquinol methylase